MFKKSGNFRDGVDTLISSNAVFTGNIEADGTVRIDGKLNGNVKVTGDVYVGSEAVIKGNIEASNIYLAGLIEGNITAKGILKILSTAKLYGDIKVNSFVADEGALFHGKCEMMDDSFLKGKDNASDSKSNADKGKKNKKGNIIEEIYEERNIS